MKCSFAMIFLLFLSGAVPANARQSRDLGQSTGSQSGSGSSSSGVQTPGTSNTRQLPGQTQGQPETQSPAQMQGGRGAGTSPSSQGTSIGGTPSSRTTAPIVTGPQQMPGAARTVQEPAALSLTQAIELAIQNNLTTLLASERRREAEGLKQEARAGLLPNVSGVAYQASLTENIGALGFQPGTFPGFTNTFIGPFNNFDARARLVQSIFNLSSIRNYQAGKAGVRVAGLQEELAREQVASFTALTYLEALRAERSVAAAGANVALAQTLVQLAQDQRNAGIATGVDVTRAQVRLAEEQVRLAQAQTSSEQARLNLQRVTGLMLGSPLTLTDPLSFTDEPLPTPETSVAEAEQTRREVRIAEEQVKVSSLERKAVSSEFLPSLEFVGDYGVSGITPTNTALPTRRVAIQLNVPIFDGGRTRGRLTVATSRQRQAELQLGSVKGQVDEDVRLALSTIRTAAAQVRAADESAQLGERELEMARDRFRAGVGDNLEVSTAQTSLANAREAQVTALAAYNAARVNLAAAMGRAETFRW